ncbi:MAG TPA: LLM class flavin-dependent oxidoreductase [Acidimicrobiales bacterium]|nr:LLM class flavin-dependent oxidoreductase [Acidimicrobiales bacterium]
MRHGVFVPPFGELAVPATTVELAVAAEAAGWDGFFLWDHMWRPPDKPAEIADAWIMLAAIASATRRLRLGPMVTPLARRRPHKVAREALTLDHLSAGRLTLGVGLGVDTGGELERFGEETNEVVRAEMLDEALEVVLGLWRGEELDHHGRHYTAAGVRFLPRPLQQPRIPLWAAARGRSGAGPVRRAARLDGLFPVDTTSEQLSRMLDLVVADRGSLDRFDVAVRVFPGGDRSMLDVPGVTWAMWSFDEGEPAAAILDAVRSGPSALGR